MIDSIKWQARLDAARGLLGMKVFDASQQLHEAVACIGLIVATSLQHCVQELPSSQELCDKIDLPEDDTASYTTICQGFTR